MKTIKENRETVQNYLDKVSAHVYYNNKQYLIIFKKEDKYMCWSGKELNEGTIREIDINYYVNEYGVNSKNVISHTLFLEYYVVASNLKYFSVRQNKTFRKFIEDLRKN